MRYSVLATAATAVFALTLTSCSGGSPEPPPLETSAEPTSSPSSTAAASSPQATPTQKATPRPTGEVITSGGAPIDATTKASAVAFTRDLLKALDVGSSTGDFADATEAFDPGCDSCKRGIAYAQGIYAQGQKIVGGQYENPTFGVNKSPVGDVVVGVESTIAAFKVVDAAGKTVGRGAAEKSTSNFHLKKSGGVWQVVEWSYSS